MKTAAQAAFEAPEADDPHHQDELNRAVYHSTGVQLFYLSKSLLAVEKACLAKYQAHVQGHDVLDIGVGAGRTSRHLAPIARRYEAIDYSPVMVSYVKNKLPEISVRQADFRDLRMFEDHSFDFILATGNVIDSLSHQDRLRALCEVRRLLRPGGLMAFSTHNLRYKRALSGPRVRWSWNPFRLSSSAAQFVLGWRHHRRVGPLRITTPEYALLNDPGHFYACLHYYVARPTVSSQLTATDMRLLDVFNGTGQTLTEAEDDSDDPWLFYVAQRI
jgi:SAM-dependent methyltransferase